jgi:hypothetical protein
MRKISGDCSLTVHPFEVGANYIIRTVSMIQTGRLVAITDNELVLEEACWVADTGRFSEFVKDMSKASEVEAIVGDFIVGRGGIIDAVKVDNLYYGTK